MQENKPKLCGCIEDIRPCAKACGLDMNGWICELETGLKQEGAVVVHAHQIGRPKEEK